MYIIIVLLFTLSAIQLYSQKSDILKDYSEYSINQVIQIRSADKNSGCVYFFTDNKSCNTCNANIKELIQVANKLKLRTVVFFYNMSYNDAERFAILNKWNVTELISDEIGAYSNMYKVKNYPCVYVLDKIGKILHITVPSESKTLSTIDYFEACTKAISNQFAELQYPHGTIRLHEQKRITLTGYNTSKMDNFPRIIWNNQTKQFIVYSRQNKECMIFDNNGKFVKSISILLVPDSISLMDTQPRINNSTLQTDLLISDYDDSKKEFFLYKLSLINNKCVLLPVYNEGLRVTGDYFYDERTGKTWSIRRPFYYKDKIKTNDGIMAVNDSGSQWFKTGFFPELYLQMLNPSPFYFCSITPIKNGIAIHPNLCDTITIFNLDGTIRRQYAVPMPTSHQNNNWLESIRTLPRNASHAYIDSLYSTINFLYSTRGDINSDILYIITRSSKQFYTQKIEDSKETAYLLRSINTNTGEQSKLYSFPYGVLPATRMNNSIVATQVREGSVELIIFNIPE